VVQVQVSQSRSAGATMEEDYESLSGIFRDMISLDSIDWDELESHFDDDESDEDEEDTDGEE